jgi:hypothetical protein
LKLAVAHAIRPVIRQVFLIKENVPRDPRYRSSFGSEFAGLAEIIVIGSATPPAIKALPMNVMRIAIASLT